MGNFIANVLGRFQKIITCKKYLFLNEILQINQNTIHFQTYACVKFSLFLCNKSLLKSVPSIFDTPSIMIRAAGMAQSV